MTLRKQQIMKIIRAVLFIILAAIVTVFLNASLASRNPEYALPDVKIIYKDAPLPADNILRASYSWDFIFTTKTSPSDDIPDWHSVAYAPVDGGIPLEIQSSPRYHSIKVSRASDAPGSTFQEVDTGNLRTPVETGSRFTYKIELSWGGQNTIVYYANFDVRSHEPVV